MITFMSKDAIADAQRKAQPKSNPWNAEIGGMSPISNLNVARWRNARR
jgi:hypothetical protein